MKNSKSKFLSLIETHEDYVNKLKNEKFHLKHKKEFDDWKVSKISKFVGKTLIFFLDLFYGKRPTIQKFKTLEIIARSPYQAFEFISFVLLSIFFGNEKKSIYYSKQSDYGKFGVDNETMHLVVISEICKKEKAGNFLMHGVVPIFASYMYFFISLILFLFSKRFGYELNYVFENHAYNQYDEFLKTNPDLKNKKLNSNYLKYYGKKFDNEYDFFLTVRNEELIHRNNSIKEIFEL